MARGDILADDPDALRDGDFLPFLAVPDGEVYLITERDQLVVGHAGEIYRIRSGCGADQQRSQEE